MLGLGSFFRTSIISSLLDMLDQNKNEDVSQYLWHGVMVKDNMLLYKAIDLLRHVAKGGGGGGVLPPARLKQVQFALNRKHAFFDAMP